jgi:PAS domain S-box-containing protein
MKREKSISGYLPMVRSLTTYAIIAWSVLMSFFFVVEAYLEEERVIGGAVKGSLLAWLTQDVNREMVVSSLAWFFGALLILIGGRYAHLRWRSKDEMLESLHFSEERFRSLWQNINETITILDIDGIVQYASESTKRVFGYEQNELIGKQFFEFLLPEDRETLRREFTEAISGTSNRLILEFRLRKPDGAIAIFEAQLANLLADQYIRGIAITSRDITERKRASEALLLSRNQMEAVAQIGAMANSTLDISEVLSHILTGTLSATGASVGMIFLRDQETGGLTWGASRGLSEAFVDDYKYRVVKPGEGLTGLIAQTGESIFIAEDSSHDPRIARPVVIAEGLNSFIGVPIYAEDEIVAVMNILTRPPDVLQEEKIALIKAIGTDVGFAIRNARLFKERMQAEEELRKSKERLHVILESTADGMLAVDTTGKTILTNKRFADLWRIPQPLIDSGDDNAMLDFVLEQLTDPDGFLNKVKALYNTAEFDRDIILFKDGRTFERYSAPMFYEAAVIGRLWSFLDITERKRAEEAQRQSENKFKTVWNNSLDGMRLTDANGIIVMVNPSFCRLFKKGSGELVGYSLADAYIPKQDEKTLEEYCERFRNHTIAPYLETEVTIWNGNKLWLELTNTFLSLPEQPESLLTVFRDVTGRKRTEQILAQERERLTVTLRSIADGVITTDTDGMIVMLNKAAEKLTGWKSDDAAGRPLSEVFVIVNELTREPCDNPVEKIIKTGDVLELSSPTCLISKDGREMVITNSGAPIRDNQSRITGVVLVFRDMTEKQKLSDSMQRAQKLESLGILAGGIAHDFNNMLAGIFGYLEMAQERATANKTDQIPKYITKALGVFDRAKGLTQQLLTFAKGGTPIRKTIQMTPLIRHSANFALSGSNVTAQFTIADDLWLCDCDENQIGQAIDNIVINGKQAMPMGGKIVISADNITDEPGHPGSFVRISIKDEGIGMPKEILSKIFDPFFSTKEAGHGLGLSTVFSIIKQHEGWIDVESKPGKGSTFQMYIPASQKTVFSGAVPELVEHKGSGTILVMDDEEFMLEIVGNMLQSMGYIVARAKDGKEALAMFTHAEKSGLPFVASILDLTIPGGTGGKETAAAIRKINPHAIVIASSGYSEDPIISNPTEHGFTDRIIKPYRKNQLTELMMRIMKH